MNDEQNQEKAYEVKDKRRVNPDGTLRENSQEEQNAEAEIGAETSTAEAAAGEETKQAHAAEQSGGELMPPPNVYIELQYLAVALSQLAWQFMGLQLAPGQKQPIKDMQQAKIAIDTVAFIADKLHPHIGEDDRKVLRNIISDLQINFVKQSAS